MKNEEMKVTGLLEKKGNLEYRIGLLRKQLLSLKGGFETSSWNCGEQPTVEIYAHGKTFRSEIDSYLLMTAVQSQIERLEKELDPIIKKLDAIELMLNS